MPEDVKQFTDIRIWSPVETKANVDKLTKFFKSFT
jgi:hypothetical protein